MKRSGSKGKFLTCFRPAVHAEEMMILDDGLTFVKSASVPTIDRSKSHASLISAARKKSSDGIILDRTVSDCSAFAAAGRGSEKSDSEGAAAVSVGRIPRRKSFSRALKSLFSSDRFHSPRANKDRKQRKRGSEFAARVSSSTGSDSTDPEFDDGSESRWSSSSSSSDDSDCEMPATAYTKRTRKSGTAPESGSSSLTLIVLVIVSLAVTVLGGKLLAVALTSMCLYTLPRRRVVVCGSGKGQVWRRSPGTEYSKKQRMVTMEGMLRRSHRHQNLQSIK